MTVRRLRLLNTLALLLVATLCAFVGGSVYSYTSSRAVDDLLRARTETLGSTVTTETTVLPDLEASAFTLHPVYVQLQRVDGTILARSPNLGDQGIQVESDLLLLGHAAYANAVVGGHLVREFVEPSRPPLGWSWPPLLQWTTRYSQLRSFSWSAACSECWSHWAWAGSWRTLPWRQSTSWRQPSEALLLRRISDAACQAT